MLHYVEVLQTHRASKEEGLLNRMVLADLSVMYRRAHEVLLPHIAPLLQHVHDSCVNVEGVNEPPGQSDKNIQRHY